MRFVTPTGWPRLGSWLIAVGIPLLIWLSAPLIQPQWPDTARLGAFLQAAAKLPEPTFLAKLPGLLLETAAIAWIATVLSVLLSLPLAFLAARNTTPWPPLAFALRSFATVSRAVPDLVWALIFAGLVNIGVLAGILALLTVSVGFFVRTYAEAFEVVGRGAIEGIAATGASSMAVRTFAVFPQAGPDLLAQTLYWFDANLRSSAVLGLVGAGRLGFELAQANRLQKYDRLWVTLAAVFLMVALIDGVSAWARRRLLA